MEPAGRQVRVIAYAGDAPRVLGECGAVAIGELSVPAGFAGPPGHIHHGFGPPDPAQLAETYRRHHRELTS